jgi:hypothetical protein
METNKTDCARHTKFDGSWWETDARGIPLCRVCGECRNTKLSRYRKVILTGYGQNDVDERIEPEE